MKTTSSLVYAKLARGISCIGWYTRNTLVADCSCVRGCFKVLYRVFHMVLYMVLYRVIYRFLYKVLLSGLVGVSYC